MTLSEKEACEVTKPTHPPWTEDGEDGWEDLLGGSSGVMRRIISVGDELQSPPEYKQTALLHVVGRALAPLSSSSAYSKPITFLDTRDAEPLQVIIGDNVLNEIPPGAMLAARECDPEKLPQCASRVNLDTIKRTACSWASRSALALNFCSP